MFPSMPTGVEHGLDPYRTAWDVWGVMFPSMPTGVEHHPDWARSIRDQCGDVPFDADRR